jgi:hypothetical protein
VATKKIVDGEMEAFLGDIGCAPRYKISITRVEPKWCAGHLGTIDVECREDISLDGIRDEFGGGLFYFKIRDGHGTYLGHRHARIDGRPLLHGRPIPPSQIAAAETPRENPASDDASLRKRLEELSERVDDLEGQVEAWEDRQRQAEALVQRALKIAESGEAEGKALVAIEKMRERREAKDAAQLRSLLLIGGMILLAKMT